MLVCVVTMSQTHRLFVDVLQKGTIRNSWPATSSGYTRYDEKDVAPSTTAVTVTGCETSIFKTGYGMFEVHDPALCSGIFVTFLEPSGRNSGRRPSWYK